MEYLKGQKRNFNLSQLAPWYLRLINSFIDLLIIRGITYLVIVLLIKSWAILNDDLNLLLIYVLTFLTYYILLEHFTGKTIGKFVTRTRVLTDDGLKPSFQNIVTRTLSRFIPFEAFSAINGQGHGWHNTISRTIVVPDSEA